MISDGGLISGLVKLGGVNNKLQWHTKQFFFQSIVPFEIECI